MNPVPSEHPPDIGNDTTVHLAHKYTCKDTPTASDPSNRISLVFVFVFLIIIELILWYSMYYQPPRPPTPHRPYTYLH